MAAFPNPPTEQPDAPTQEPRGAVRVTKYSILDAPISHLTHGHDPWSSPMPPPQVGGAEQSMTYQTKPTRVMRGAKPLHSTQHGVYHTTRNKLASEPMVTFPP